MAHAAARTQDAAPRKPAAPEAQSARRPLERPSVTSLRAMNYEQGRQALSPRGQGDKLQDQAPAHCRTTDLARKMEEAAQNQQRFDAMQDLAAVFYNRLNDYRALCSDAVRLAYERVHNEARLQDPKMNGVGVDLFVAAMGAVPAVAAVARILTRWQVGESLSSGLEKAMGDVAKAGATRMTAPQPADAKGMARATVALAGSAMEISTSLNMDVAAEHRAMEHLVNTLNARRDACTPGMLDSVAAVVALVPEVSPDLAGQVAREFERRLWEQWIKDNVSAIRSWRGARARGQASYQGISHATLEYLRSAFPELGIDALVEGAGNMVEDGQPKRCLSDHQIRHNR
jgi:hypothetical protein